MTICQEYLSNVISTGVRRGGRSGGICGCFYACLASQNRLPTWVTMPLMHEGSYFTCIVASRSHTLYIGVTGNLERRVFEHKWKERGGFTEKYNCDRLVWFESHQDVAKAIARDLKTLLFAIHRSSGVNRSASPSGTTDAVTPVKSRTR